MAGGDTEALTQRQEVPRLSLPDSALLIGDDVGEDD